MTPKGIMIFAAGFGTRMAPLTNDRPKPLIKVAGKPLIDHALDIAKSAQTDPIIINAHYKADQIQSHMAGKNATVLVENSILDTGGGLKSARPHFPNQAAFTLNSDAVWNGPNPLTHLQHCWRPHMGALLLCADNPVGRNAGGDFNITNTGQISRDPNGRFTYLGAQIIALDYVANHPETVFSLNDVWDDLIAQNLAYGCVYPGEWCDVGRPENIELAENLLQKSPL